MTIEVRPARANDREAVLRLAPRLHQGVAAWRSKEGVTQAAHGWLITSLNALEAGDHAAWVAEHNGDVIGFASVCEQAHWSGEMDAYIGELVVAQEHEGRGVARTLLATVEHWARSQKLTRIRLSTGAANDHARRMYEHYGYQAEDVTLTRPL